CPGPAVFWCALCCVAEFHCPRGFWVAAESEAAWPCQPPRLAAPSPALLSLSTSPSLSLHLSPLFSPLHTTLLLCVSTSLPSPPSNSPLPSFPLMSSALLSF